MKYKWLEDIDYEKLSQAIGCQVKSVTRGGIIVGYEDGIDDLTGEPIQVPITKNGVEIELENETAENLAKLDIFLQGLKRAGGRDLPSVIVDNLVLEYPNPYKETYKLSQLYGLTHQQLDTYIDNNVTNLAQAKEFLKKLSAVTLWLVKQTKLDQ